MRFCALCLIIGPLVSRLRLVEDSLIGGVSGKERRDGGANGKNGCSDCRAHDEALILGLVHLFQVLVSVMALLDVLHQFIWFGSLFHVPTPGNYKKVPRMMILAVVK